MNLVEISSREVARKNKNREVSSWHLLMSILLIHPKKSEIKNIETKTLKNIKQDTLYEIEKLEKVLIGTNEIVIPKISREIFTLIDQTKKEFKSKTLIGIKEIFYQILKTKKLLKKYKLNKLSFNFDEDNIITSIDKIRLIETYKEFEDETRQSDYFEINKYVKNLTTLAKEKKLDPLIGREKEIQSLISILERRNKSSTILIGEPGIGKTAIVEGLAIKIANKEIKSQLQNKIILQIETSDLVSGTKYRGEFEERLNNIIKSKK